MNHTLQLTRADSETAGRAQWGVRSIGAQAVTAAGSERISNALAPCRTATPVLPLADLAALCRKLDHSRYARTTFFTTAPAGQPQGFVVPASLLGNYTLLRISYPVPVRLRRSRSALCAVRKHARAAALRGYETTRHGQPPLRNTSGGAERSARAPSCMSSPGDRSPKHCRKAQSQGSTGPPPAAGAAAPSILRSPAARGAALQPLHPALPPPGCPADQARAARPCSRAAPSRQPRTQADLASTRPAPAQALLRACSLPRCVCQQEKPKRCAPLSSRAAGFPAPTF